MGWWMRKNLAILSLLLAVVVVGFVFYGLPPSEPSYQGKPLSHWIRGLEYLNVNPSEEHAPRCAPWVNPPSPGSSPFCNGATRALNAGS